MFENFIKQDVDDMIFGSAEIRCIDHAKAWLFCFYRRKGKKGPLPREFSSREADFSCLCTVCVIYFFG